MASHSAETHKIPRLEMGDRLTRSEFERRYKGMPKSYRAELVEGVVYLAPPVDSRHCQSHFRLIAWLCTYDVGTPGVVGADSASFRLDWDNELQPDGHLRIESGGRSQISGEHLEGAPELAVEVATSSVSYDLHAKLPVYRRSGVQEYIVWRTQDQYLDWFFLVNEQYQPLPSDDAVVLRSRVFPGLWIDRPAFSTGDMAKVMAVLQQGIASPEHAEFVAKLESQRPK
jgi:Uma2 family endonuclease